MIDKNQIPAIASAVETLVGTFGHPDEIPMGELAKQGIDPSVAEQCEALLTSQDFPDDPVSAVAKWMRLIGEFSE